MPKCPKCGKEAGMSFYCVNCGTLIREECPSCGELVNVSMKFCPKCGKRNRLYPSE
jgi:membrane protease subunit (stomatin/prohibitin family)